MGVLTLPLLLLLTQAEPLPPVLDDIAVTADEPRFVAPTRRDRIGRIWAPVLVNGQGPFRLVLDTGASHSALTPRLAQAIGISAGYREHGDAARRDRLRQRADGAGADARVR